MNREIKFRALKDDISNCKFVYGQLVYDAIGTPRITEIDKSGEGLLFHTCIKNTECQFTGLKDKNGKEIYEGDIIKSVSVIAQVLFGEYEGLMAWHVLIKDGIEWALGSGEILGLNEGVEVIGNIYENPDLV